MGPARGEKVVLVRLETSPEDIDGHEERTGYPDRARWHDALMQLLWHVVWVPAVYPDAADIAMDEANKKFTLAGKEYHEGDWHLH